MIIFIYLLKIININYLNYQLYSIKSTKIFSLNKFKIFGYLENSKILIINSIYNYFQKFKFHSYYFIFSFYLLLKK